MIAGQRPVITRSRKSIATFKVRENMALGCQGHAARRSHVRVPGPPGQHRAAAREGLPRAEPEEFRRSRQLSLGLKEHIVFPEIDYDQVDEIWGMDVIVCTTAGSDDEARELLRAFNFPFRQ
jgi:large subunit ribosomal protein L5